MPQVVLFEVVNSVLVFSRDSRPSRKWVLGAVRNYAIRVFISSPLVSTVVMDNSGLMLSSLHMSEK